MRASTPPLSVPGSGAGGSLLPARETLFRAQALEFDDLPVPLAPEHDPATPALVWWLWPVLMLTLAGAGWLLRGA